MVRDLSNPVRDLIEGVWNLILDDDETVEVTTVQAIDYKSKHPSLDPISEGGEINKHQQATLVSNTEPPHEDGVPGTIVVVTEAKEMKTRFMANENLGEVATPEAKINRFMARKDIMAQLLSGRDDPDPPKENSIPRRTKPNLLAPFASNQPSKPKSSRKPRRSKSLAHKEQLYPRFDSFENSDRDVDMSEDRPNSSYYSHSTRTRSSTIPSQKTPPSRKLHGPRSRNSSRRDKKSKSEKRGSNYGGEFRDPPPRPPRRLRDESPPRAPRRFRDESPPRAPRRFRDESPPRRSHYIHGPPPRRTHRVLEYDTVSGRNSKRFYDSPVRHYGYEYAFNKDMSGASSRKHLYGSEKVKKTNHRLRY